MHTTLTEIVCIGWALCNNWKQRLGDMVYKFTPATQVETAAVVLQLLGESNLFNWRLFYDIIRTGWI